MTNLKIEKGIPLQKSVVAVLLEMEVDDSFFIERSANYISANTKRASKKSGYKFASRSEGNGRRVWRVA